MKTLIFLAFMAMNSGHQCDWKHFTQCEIDALNTLAERRILDPSLVNALFEEDMRCGKDSWQEFYYQEEKESGT